MTPVGRNGGHWRFDAAHQQGTPVQPGPEWRTSQSVAVGSGKRLAF